MKNPFVSVIIINWNGKKYLKDCLDSICNVDYDNKEIILVDNASSDNSVEFVKDLYPAVKILENKENLGFAQGHDIGFKHAEGEAILLLNTDTIVEKNLIKQLVKTLYSKENIAAVQPKVVMYPDTSIIDSIGSFFLLSGILYHFGREKNADKREYNEEMEIFSAKGVCILFKKKVLEKTGLFDKDYFAYFEETDLCMRILLAGYKIIYTPLTKVFHIGGATSAKLPAAFILFHSYKNRIMTYIKNLSLKYLLVVIPFTIFFYVCAFFLYLLRGNISAAVIIPKAIYWNFVNLSSILKKRSYIQKKIRVVADDDYLPRLMRRVHISYYWYILIGGLAKYKD